MSDVRSTSNARQVPKPITGSVSPDEGMVRVSIVDDSVAACVVIGKTTAAAVPPINLAASRRVIVAL